MKMAVASWAPSGGRGLAVLLTLAAFAVGAPASFAEGEGPPRIRIDLVVTRISDEPGGIDPRGGNIHRKLRREFRYESLEVLQTVKLKLRLDEVGGLRLPDGRRVRVKPMLIDDRGALLAVEIEGLVQTDLRVKSDHMVIIGAQRQGNGRLVIALDPHF